MEFPTGYQDKTGFHLGIEPADMVLAFHDYRLPRHGQTPVRRLHLPESECSGAPDAHQLHRGSRRESAQTFPRSE
jgi:hypothetical protein